MSNAWTTIGLTQDQVTSQLNMQIMKRFAGMKAEMPREAALFSRNVIENPDLAAKGYFEVLYFSPASTPFIQDLIREYNGSASGAPPKAGTGLLAGYQEAIKLLDGVSN